MARLFTSSWMNIFLLAVPLGWLAYFLHWNAIAVFVLVSMPSQKRKMPFMSSAHCLVSHPFWPSFLAVQMAGTVTADGSHSKEGV